MASTATQLARMFPSTSTLLSLYASFSTILMLLRNVYREIVPKKLESFVLDKLSVYFSGKPPKSCVTFIIDDSWDGLKHNQLIDAATLYLSTKIGAKNKVIRIGKFEHQKNATTALVEGEKVVDVFDGIEITWKYVRSENKDDQNRSRGRMPSMKGGGRSNTSQFNLIFEEEHREKILNEYLAHVLKTYEALTHEKKVLKLYSREHREKGRWMSIDFSHPSTFDTLAMDKDLKKDIIDDLDRFLMRKDYYKRIGKAWRRGYLLYGPPGTGKSSLIAAMANYMNFNIYDLEFASIYSDSDLRQALLDTNSKSIIVVEDIDCNVEAQDRSKFDFKDPKIKFIKRFSLSGLLNAIDGLWSSCGEERIIVFTTNHKEALDPALLRPGRMDVHIHLSYCTAQGFRVLASNYLGIQDHKCFEEIDGLIQGLEVTPATIAEQLMHSESADIALGEVLRFLKKVKIEKDQIEEKNET